MRRRAVSASVVGLVLAGGMVTGCSNYKPLPKVEAKPATIYAMTWDTANPTPLPECSNAGGVGDARPCQWHGANGDELTHIVLEDGEQIYLASA